MGHPRSIQEWCCTWQCSYNLYWYNDLSLPLCGKYASFLCAHVASMCMCGITIKYKNSLFKNKKVSSKYAYRLLSYFFSSQRTSRKTETFFPLEKGMERKILQKEKLYGQEAVISPAFFHGMNVFVHYIYGKSPPFAGNLPLFLSKICS